MKKNKGIIKKGDHDSNAPFISVSNEQVNKIMEYKLKGKTDTEVARTLDLAQSTVNKHYHKKLKELADTSNKDLDNLRFQQYLRFERVFELAMERLSRNDYESSKWATIVTRLLTDQSRLYGLNSTDTNINIDNRQQTIESNGIDPREELSKRINNHVKWQVKATLCMYVIGEELNGTPTQEARLKELLGDLYE